MNGAGTGTMTMPTPYRSGSRAGAPDVPPKHDYSAPAPGMTPLHGSQSHSGQVSPADTGQGLSQGQGHRDATKRNPLVDLMDSEKVYVEHLGLVIRVSLGIQLGIGKTVLQRGKSRGVLGCMM